MSKKHRFEESKFLVKPGAKLDLDKFSTEAGKELKDKQHGGETLEADVSALQEAQQVLYASGTHSLLIIFQGMDAAGKDGTIRHVMGAINPQGCRVYPFKAPNDTELQHHFLWRPMAYLPERGMISIFNRSYYEEVLVVRVHPKFLVPQRIPGLDINDSHSLQRLWEHRFEQIRYFEETIASHGTLILKFFLNVSKEEQKKRFLERLTNPEKYWKFNSADLAERRHWQTYREAFEEALAATSTKHAPWYVIPADNKWYLRAAVADILAARLEKLDLRYPKVDEQESKHFKELAEQLKQE
ncbi:MAG: polyphosphate kinase 2 family protein [bacterium]|nr:polyphosphate kinase 2 family protein [bacterium]